MKICAVSDLHGYLPKNINECDIIVICGDTFPLDIQRSIKSSELWFRNNFKNWVESLPCDKVFFIGGNHCFWLESIGYDIMTSIINEIGLSKKLVYLENTLYDYNGYKIFGCPWCTGPIGWAFIDQFGNKYNEIPDCDILLTHQPPRVGKISCSFPNTYMERDFGSDRLRETIASKKIGYLFCGHIHSGLHEETLYPTSNVDTKFYNVSIKDEDYMPSYEPLYLDI